VRFSGSPSGCVRPKALERCRSGSGRAWRSGSPRVRTRPRLTHRWRTPMPTGRWPSGWTAWQEPDTTRRPTKTTKPLVSRNSGRLPGGITTAPQRGRTRVSTLRERRCCCAEASLLHLAWSSRRARPSTPIAFMETAPFYGTFYGMAREAPATASTSQPGEGAIAPSECRVPNEAAQRTSRVRPVVSTKRVLRGQLVRRSSDPDHRIWTPSVGCSQTRSSVPRAPSTGPPRVLCGRGRTIWVRSI